MEKSKNVRRAVYKIDESMKEKFPAKTTTNEVKDELAYCEKVISVIEKEAHLVSIPAVKEKLNVLKEVVEDYTEQLHFSADSDARVGHKTEDSSFFGYKTHIAMNDERIITAAIVTTGEQGDGFFTQRTINLNSSPNCIRALRMVVVQRRMNLSSIRMRVCTCVKQGIWRFEKRV